MTVASAPAEGSRVQSAADLPADGRLLAAIGWVVMFATFGGFGVWSALAPLGAAVIAPGIVAVDTARKTVQHLEGGVVRSIRVRDGDRVAAGQVLLELDGAQVRAAMSSLQPLLAANRAQKARLMAERDGLERITFPDDLARPTDPATVQILSNEEALFLARRQALESQTRLLASRADGLRSSRQGLERQIVSKQRELGLARDELEANRKLLASKFVSLRQVESLERSVAQLEGEAAALESRRGEIDSELLGAGLERDQLGKAFRRDVEAELERVERESYELLERVKSIGDQYDRLTVKAPVSGVVVNMAMHTVGGVIAPGTPILDIVPDGDELVVEAMVRPDDIAGLAVGLPADIRFPSFHRNDLKPLRGEVVTISADRIAAPPTGAGYYLAKLRVAKGELAKLEDYRLLPGMPAEVAIAKGRRTLLDYMLEPVANLTRRAFRE